MPGLVPGQSCPPAMRPMLGTTFFQPLPMVSRAESCSSARHEDLSGPGRRRAPRRGRFLGDIDHTPGAVRRLVTKLAGKYRRLLFCYEAGPTGYGLQRQISDLGHDCAVIAPSLIPKRPGERVKTNRRDAAHPGPAASRRRVHPALGSRPWT